MNQADVANMNRGFENLAQTLLQNKVLRQQAASRGQQQNQFGQEMGLRGNELQERIQRNLIDEAIRKQNADTAGKRADTGQQNADTAASKSQKVWYFVSPNTRNVKTFTGTPKEAQAHLEQLQSLAPNGEQLSFTDKEPDSVKNLNRIILDPNKPDDVLYADDEGMQKFVEQKQKAAADAQKQKAAADAQKLKSPTPVAPRETVRQVVNPAHVVGGVVDTNTPPFLSLTNRVTPLPIGDSGLTNLAPQTAGASAPKKPTRAQAAHYVSKFGEDAKKKLQADGYDITGYAD